MSKVLFLSLLIQGAMSIDFDIVCENEIKSRVLYDDYLMLPKPEFSPENVKFYLYKKENQRQRIRLKNDTLDEVDKKLNTKVIVHDWFEGSLEDWISKLKNAYLQNLELNVIVVDYEKYAKYYYSSTVKIIEEIAMVIAEFLQELSENSLIKLEDAHFIGFGLGAHVSGVAGRKTKMLAGKKVGRITGLDPLGLYMDSDEKTKLKKTDASFVDVIHTNNEWLGSNEQLGHVDFLVNGGDTQPLCTDTKMAKLKFKLYNCVKAYNDLTCSHLRSTIYWTESIARNKFITNGIIMGEFGSLSAKGSYAIKTRVMPPYGLG